MILSLITTATTAVHRMNDKRTGQSWSIQVGLISCTKSKRDSSAVPRDLYDTSALFRKARAYCKQHHDSWYILSAKHHLLEPDGQSIAPYDETLTTATVDERRKWAKNGEEQLDEAGLLDGESTLVIHAGKAYYEHLLPLVESAVVDVRIPTEGLAIGETLAWYNEH
jgi:hypothetical protein